MVNPPQYMRTLTARDSTRPTRLEAAPSRPKAPSPASGAAGDEPDTQHGQEARRPGGASARRSGGRRGRSPHTTAIITWALRLSFMLP